MRLPRAPFTAVAVAAIAAALASASSDVCLVEHDAAYAYTDCANGMQRAVPYWLRDCSASDGTLPTSHLFSCALRCPAGSVAGHTGVCEPCPAGTYAQTHHEWRAPFYAVPDEAFAICTPRSANTTQNPCPDDRWMPCDDHGCLMSGTNPDDRVSYDNDVAFTIVVDSYPASISFDYSVSSEPYFDYLAVWLDGQSIVVDSGDKTEWKSKTVDLPRPPRPACYWTIGGACMFPNQLAPFDRRTFFDAAEFQGSGENVPVLLRLNDQRCPPEMSDVAGSLVLVVMGLAGEGCDPITIIHAAGRNGARGVIIGLPEGTVINGSSEGLIFDNFAVAQVSVDDARGLEREISRRVPPALLVRFSPRSGDMHRLTFSYSKDASVSVGEDRARVRNIVVRGAKGLGRCVPCEPGLASEPGATECVPCPRNRFGPSHGTAFPCMACPTGEASQPGATRCIPAETCTLADYVPVRSHCAVSRSTDTFNPDVLNFTHEITYEAHDPPTCDIAHSAVELPDPMIGVPCPTCPPTQFRNSQTGQCQSCSTKTYLTTPGAVAASASDVCSTCEVGTYASQSLVLDGFDSWHNVLPPWVAVSCTACVGASWALADSAPTTRTIGTAVLAVGRGILAGAVARLELRLSVVAPSPLTFTYMLLRHVSGSSNNGGARLTFKVIHQVNDRNVTHFSSHIDRPTRSSTPYEFQAPNLPAGLVFVVWEYANINSNASRLDPADVYAIRSLKLYGVTIGSAVSCVPCPVGYHCPPEALGPVVCPVGTYSPGPGSVTCRECPFGTVSPRLGANTCDACPSGTFPSVDRRYCRLQHCTLFEPGTPKDIAAAGPIRWSNEPLWRLPVTRIPLDGFIGENAFPITGIDGSGDSRLQGVTLYFKTCAPTTTQCSTDSEPAYGCARGSDGAWFSLGNRLVPQILRQGNDTVGVRLQLEGVQCHEHPDLPMATDITIDCDMDVGEHHVLVSSRAYSPCNYSLHIRSRSACPVCSNDSFVHLETACTGDPAVRTTYSDYAFANGTIAGRATCVPGLEVPPSTTEKCPWVQLSLDKELTSTSWLLVLIIVLLLLIFLLGMCCALVSRQRLSQKYRRLQGAAATGGAPAFPSDDVELGNQHHPAAVRRPAGRAGAPAEAAGSGPPVSRRDDEVPVVPRPGGTADEGRQGQHAAEQVVDYSDAGDEGHASQPAPSHDHAV